jgi:hypothetical protein
MIHKSMFIYNYVERERRLELFYDDRGTDENIHSVSMEIGSFECRILKVIDAILMNLDDFDVLFGFSQC